MFDALAERYDLTNDVLSVGQDRRWRRSVVQAVGAAPGERILDLAAGTGTSSVPLAATGANVVACDFSVGMVRLGRRRYGSVRFVAGDALRLPFADGVFDAVTISFGLRNVVDVPAALGELARVTAAGGRLVVCEFSRPTWAPLRRVYHAGVLTALPLVAARVSSNPEAYRYLAESIREWPGQAELADVIATSGWASVSWRNLTGGIVALHRAQRR